MPEDRTFNLAGESSCAKQSWQLQNDRAIIDIRDLRPATLIGGPSLRS